MRGDVTNEEWAIISELLLPKRGRWSRSAIAMRIIHKGG